MPNLGPWEIVAILVVLVLLFGAKKLPEAARGIGRSLRIFKAEIKDPSDEEGRDAAEGLPPATQQQSIAATPPPVTPVVVAPVQQPVAQPVVPPLQQPQPVAQPVQPVEQPAQPPLQQSPTDR